MLDHHFLTTKMHVPLQLREFHVFLRATAQKTVRNLCLKCALSAPKFNFFRTFAQKSCRSLNTHDVTLVYYSSIRQVLSDLYDMIKEIKIFSKC